MKPVVFQDKYGNGYLYSFYRKRLLPLDHQLYKLAYLYLFSNYEEFEKLYKQDLITKERFDFLKINLFFEEKVFLVDGKIEVQDIQESLQSLPLLIFEVTNVCNLKCKYCIYGEMYTVFTSSETKELTFELAKSVIDYFVNICLSRGNSKQTISFYGGEPLLKFDLIKKIIEYTQKINSISYSYTITTNGMLLDKYYKQLIAWDVRLLVSLDGDRYSSQYRICKNGKESYGKVYNNLVRIRKENPVYFRKMVDFNSVMHDKNPLCKLLGFMKNEFNKIPQCSSLSPAFLKDEYRNEFNRMANNNYVDVESSCEKISMEAIYRSKPQVMAILSVMNGYSGYTFRDFNQLLTYNQVEHYLPSGTCIPFSSRLLISSNGILYPCERIEYSYSLGRVQDGEMQINMDEICEYYNLLYEKIRDKCSKCYSVYNCNNCLFQNDLNCQYVTKDGFIKMLQKTIDGIYMYGKNFKK